MGVPGPADDEGTVTNYNKDTNGNPYVDVYGANDFVLNGMEAVEGTIDLTAAIPTLLYRQIAKVSIIERLRQK